MSDIVLVLEAIVFLISAVIIFRVIVRRDYLNKGKLSWYASSLEFIIFALHANSAYLFLPSSWPELPALPPFTWQIIFGVSIAVIGFLALLSTMIYLGISKAFGLKADGLRTTGSYRFTRNPQLIFYLLVLIGIAIIWLSWYAIIWVFLYLVIAHVMVLTEEEHLGKVYGEDYRRYCQHVPCYL